MKKFIAVASLFLFNNEVISWIALTVIAFMAIIAFFKEVDRQGGIK